MLIGYTAHLFAGRLYSGNPG